MTTKDFDQLINSRHLLNDKKSGDIFEKVYEFQKIIGPIRDLGKYPYFQPFERHLGTEAIIRGKKVIMLGSNNYLGLTTHPKVREAAIEALQKYGTSATGSRLLNGSLDLHETFEHEIAQFLGKEAALVFTTGYQVNLGIITALANQHTTVYMDKSNHASLYDAVKMSTAQLEPFRHNNLNDLDRLLSQTPSTQGKLVAVDGVFSMEGDIAPLPEIAELCRTHKARLLVDDAHGLGVLGARGQGTAAHFGVTQEVDLIMATFSKSLASTGGYVAGNFAVIDYIKHFGRSMIFSASITPSNLAAAREALKILIQEPERVEQVNGNARKLKKELVNMGWQIGPTETPILPVYIGNDLLTGLIWNDLLDAGVYVNPIIYPAIDKNKSLLRVSTMTTHTDSQLNQALEAFQIVGVRYGILQKNVINAFR